MKKSLHHILLSVCIAFTAFVSSAYAQENGTADFEVTDSERDRAERDHILYSPGEGETRYVPKNSSTIPTQSTTSKETAKESSSRETLKEADLKTGTPIHNKVKPEMAAHTSKAGEKQAAQPKANDDGTILSFNFLYYIIQKYKLQDIIID
jgi:hypothetical protein